MKKKITLDNLDEHIRYYYKYQKQKNELLYCDINKLIKRRKKNEKNM